jgi:hypothetical protein
MIPLDQGGGVYPPDTDIPKMKLPMWGQPPSAVQRRRSRACPDSEPTFQNLFQQIPGFSRTQGRRLISDATYPAPNPLSMFTTLTFEAHEFSMPNSAAIPLNDAP